MVCGRVVVKANLRVTCDRHCKHRREVNTSEARLDEHEKWGEWREGDD